MTTLYHYDLTRHLLSETRDTADVAPLHRTYIGSVERDGRNITLPTIVKPAGALEVER